MKPYPLFLIGLERRRCLVIGGGAQAKRKVDGLLDVDADVTVIAPEICDALAEDVAAGRIAHVARRYRPGDLRDAFLAVSIDQPPELRDAIRDEARRWRVLLNTEDDVERCDFVYGSVVRRGALAVSISTSGLAPALAVRLRERLEAELGPELSRFLELAAAAREPLRRRHPGFDERRRRWYALLDAGVLELLRSNREPEARALFADLLGLVDSA